MKTITIKNFQIDSAAKIISYPMSFQKGRIKNRFLSILREKSDAVNKSRLEMLTELSEKDPETKTPIFEDNSFKLSDENRKKFNTEYQKLMNEECVIDVLPSWEKDIPEIKQMMNDSPVELTEQQTAECEYILQALNDMKKEVKEGKKDKKAK